MLFLLTSLNISIFILFWLHILSLSIDYNQIYDFDHFDHVVMVKKCYCYLSIAKFKYIKKIKLNFCI